VTLFVPELTPPLMVSPPLPDTRRRTNRSYCVEELPHIHGLRAVPPPGTSTECVPRELSNVFESPPTIYTDATMTTTTDPFEATATARQTACLPPG
jgi:hypothetical protein